MLFNIFAEPRHWDNHPSGFEMALVASTAVSPLTRPKNVSTVGKRGRGANQTAGFEAENRMVVEQQVGSAKQPNRRMIAQTIPGA